MTSEKFWDNHRVPFNPYSVFPRTVMNEVKNSRGLHFFKYIYKGTRKNSIFQFASSHRYYAGPSRIPRSFAAFLKKFKTSQENPMSDEVAKFRTKSVL